MSREIQIQIYVQYNISACFENTLNVISIRCIRYMAVYFPCWVVVRAYKEFPNKSNSTVVVTIRPFVPCEEITYLHLLDLLFKEILELFCVYIVCENVRLLHGREKQSAMLTFLFRNNIMGVFTNHGEFITFFHTFSDSFIMFKLGSSTNGDVGRSSE